MNIYFKRDLFGGLVASISSQYKACCAEIQYKNDVDLKREVDDFLLKTIRRKVKQFFDYRRGSYYQMTLAQDEIYKVAADYEKALKYINSLSETKEFLAFLIPDMEKLLPLQSNPFYKKEKEKIALLKEIMSFEESSILTL